jgi:formate hydrogenlyase subunit 3/multisubunit Na+/H+ antiporter MnhD subunit
MVLSAGIWAAVESNLSRMLGFAIILDIGFSLLTISLAIGNDPITFRMIFFAGLLPRGLCLGLLALAMSSLISKTRSFNIEDFRGLAKIYPVISTSIVVALFCLAGLPLLAGFPFKLGVIEQVSSQMPGISIWVIVGSFGLITGTIRFLISMVSDGIESEEKKSETRILILFLAVGIGLLFLIGLLPNIFLQVITNFPGAFIALG